MTAPFRTFIARNWFVISLLIGVAVATVLRTVIASVDPGAIVRGSVRGWAVVAIFVLIGASLPSERILSSLARLRVHLLIQTVIFVVFPIGITLIVALSGDLFLTNAVIVGLFAVAVLPTSGSSCVVFTQAADGDVVIATTNATIANTLGIVVSPLLLSFLLGTQGMAIPPAQLVAVVRELVLRMLLPLALGQVIRAWKRDRVAAHERGMRAAASALIVLVVFLSASSALDSGFGDLVTPAMAVGLALLAIFHLALLPLLYYAGRILRFSHPERVAAVFVGSQKTLALGAPLLALYFADRPDLFASALVPLMFYHLFQLVIGGVVQNRLLALRS